MSIGKEADLFAEGIKADDEKSEETFLSVHMTFSTATGNPTILLKGKPT